MQFFIFTDFDRWDAVNRRHFDNLRGQGQQVSTTQHLEIRRDPNDANRYAAAVTQADLGKMGKYLAEQEAADFSAGLVASVTPDWNGWEVIQ